MQKLVDLTKNNTLADQVYINLRDKIINRELPPGTRLKHQEIAEALGVSNTPVREAIRALEKDGLVETLPYRGSVVKAMSAKETRDLYDVRTALEALAVRLAVDKITDMQLKRVEETVHHYETAFENGDVALGMEADLQFHDLLAQASGNETLLMILRELTNRVQVLRRLDKGKMRRRQSLDDHRAILKALEERDATKVEALVVQHIEKGKQHVLHLIAKEGASQPQVLPTS